MKPEMLVCPCTYDSNSVSLYDANRKNAYGEMYCVQSAILESEVPILWPQYIKQIETPKKSVISKLKRIFKIIVGE